MQVSLIGTINGMVNGMAVVAHEIRQYREHLTPVKASPEEAAELFQLQLENLRRMKKEMGEREDWQPPE